MRQLVLEAPGMFLEREAPQPAVPPGYALVHVGRVGVCGSDFHAFAGRHPIYTYPRIIGHELSAIVRECPPNTKEIHPGDRCAIEPYLTCGKCRTCLQGRGNCCENLQLLGIHVDGGMQECLSVPISLLHKSEILTLDQLALVETLGIGAHAVDRSAIKTGQLALVVGAGPIGIAVAQFAAERGARIHVIEKSDWRRNFVKILGFTASAPGEICEADVVFDATGSALAMSESINHVAYGGTLVFVGLTRDEVCLDDSMFHRKEITLLASRNSFGLFPRIIQLVEEGRIDTSHWVTDRLTLSQVATEFPSLSQRATLIKAIVDLQ